jgi:hypothetical protein
MPGFGRVQKQIRRAFLAHPCRTYRTADLVLWAYPRLRGAIERKQSGAVCRAAQRVAVRVRRDAGRCRLARQRAPLSLRKAPSDRHLHPLNL